MKNGEKLAENREKVDGDPWKIEINKAEKSRFFGRALGAASLALAKNRGIGSENSENAKNPEKIGAGNAEDAEKSGAENRENPAGISSDEFQIPAMDSRK